MRFILFLIMSVSGDVETEQIQFESINQCLKAQKEIKESVKASPMGDLQVHGAYCLEVRY